MISKMIRRNGRTGSEKFAALLDYVTAEGKATQIVRHNLHSRSSDAEQMESIANQRRDRGRPAVHLVISWHEGEQPTPHQVEIVLKEFIERLKLERHQVVGAIHSDTENTHLHLVINKISLEGKKASFSHDYRIRDAACRHLERIHGWRVDRGGKFMAAEKVMLNELGRPVDATRAAAQGTHGERPESPPSGH